MRTARSRLPKGFSLDERLAQCADAIESQPEKWAGSWRSWDAALLAASGDAPASTEVSPASRSAKSPQCSPRRFERVCLDLGCGKGGYTVACAEAHPDTLFVGIDVEGLCVLRAAECALERGVSNVAFVLDDDPFLDLSRIFAPGELSAILLSFPTPYPKKKKAPFRLTYVDRLMAYRSLLEEGGVVRFRTDSQPLRDFSLTQFSLAGYDVEWSSDDVRSLFPQEPWSEYERKLVAQGASVHGIQATPRMPGPDPATIEQTAPLSLVSYLPEDIENMGYVPHGMQGCVKNMRGRRARQRSKGLPEWTAPKV